jgi:hypothetical protein
MVKIPATGHNLHVPSASVLHSVLQSVLSPGMEQLRSRCCDPEKWVTALIKRAPKGGHCPDCLMEERGMNTTPSPFGSILVHTNTTGSRL